MKRRKRTGPHAGCEGRLLAIQRSAYTLRREGTYAGIDLGGSGCGVASGGSDECGADLHLLLTRMGEVGGALIGR